MPDPILENNINELERKKFLDDVDGNTSVRTTSHITDPNTGNEARVVNGALDVNIQDQASPLFLDRITEQVTGPYTLASATIPGDYDIVLDNATGLNVNDYIGLFQNSTNPNEYFGNIKSISSNTLTMYTPLDAVFDPVGNSPELFELNDGMAVDGSSTPRIFSLINVNELATDITRIIIHITDGSSMDDGKFGSLSALTAGCVLRKKYADGSFINYFTVRTNGELGEIAYDKSYDSKAPSGVFGVSVRLTFAGQSKIGAVVRLEQTEELQMIIQDNLSSLSSFTMSVQGHISDERQV